MPTPALAPLSLVPIGVIRTPFRERVSAPRQTALAHDVRGTLVLDEGRNFEHALSDIEGWEYLWVLYWFHGNLGWRPKVLPPRSRRRRGVFATRAPHRPNPIGLSVVRLEKVHGLTLHVRGLDMLDGSPLLDIKPYVAYADAFPAAANGWLDGDQEAALDPLRGYEVQWSPLAARQASWLHGEQGIDLVSSVERVLRLGPEPHPYRRIRAEKDGMRLAIKDWRVQFRVEGTLIVVDSLSTGYRPRQLAGETDAKLAVHRRFVARFEGEPNEVGKGRK
jgi:tRNA-Thr(GGU) m(6)t(6)A37 methyltransferase TsaA